MVERLVCYWIFGDGAYTLLHVTIICIMVLLLVYCLLCLESTTPMLVYDGSSPPRGWIWW
jgi:hypothetical protein